MNKFDYLNILKNNVAPSVEKLGLSENWIFQQDNDPKQKSKIVSEWLLYRTPKTLDHPPQSPDLNPIEHLWEHLDRKKLTEEWSKISPEVTKNLTESMPRRLTEVLKSKESKQNIRLLYQFSLCT
uniref:Transposable element Tcb1 transposase n=1 Tax=Bactrocera latifrons TaxID=174628 RepID=A0A0K8U1Y0_BACLA